MAQAINQLSAWHRPIDDANPSTKPSQPPAANPQAQGLAQRQQALAPRMPVTTATTAIASIVPKSGVFAPNTAAAAKPEAWSRQT